MIELWLMTLFICHNLQVVKIEELWTFYEAIKYDNGKWEWKMKCKHWILLKMEVGTWDMVVSCYYQWGSKTNQM